MRFRSYTDLNFDALLHAVHQLPDDADATLPVPSQNANSFVAQRYPTTWSSPDGIRIVP